MTRMINRHFGILLALTGAMALLTAIPVTFYPYTPRVGGKVRGPAGALSDQFTLRKYSLSAAQAATASTTGVHAAVTDNGAPQVITTAITNPPVARNITATAGGIAADVKAIQVIVAGTNLAGVAITETLPAFTVNTTGTVVGVKAFATVTSITIPAHDGTGATTAIGFGDIIGLPDYLDETDDVLYVTFNHVKEATPATVVADADELEKNTVDLNSALNGSAVDIVYAA